MNVMKPILENPVYSVILLRINTKELQLKDIVKETKKKHPVLLNQLRLLKEEKYIGLQKKGKKKFYFVKWDRIIKAYFDYLYGIKPINIPKKYKDDSTLKKVIQEIFKGYSKENVTLKHIFGNITKAPFDQMIPGTKFSRLMDIIHENYFFWDGIFNDIIDEIERKIFK